MTSDSEVPGQEPVVVSLKVKRLKEGDPDLYIEVDGQRELRATPLRKMRELFPSGEGEVQDRRTGQYFPISLKDWENEDPDTTYIKVEFHYKRLKE